MTQVLYFGTEWWFPRRLEACAKRRKWYPYAACVGTRLPGNVFGSSVIFVYEFAKRQRALREGHCGAKFKSRSLLAHLGVLNIAQLDPYQIATTC